MTDEEDPLVVGREQLADVLGVQVPALYKMRNRGMPWVGRGRYHIPTCVRWYIEDLKNRGAIDPEEADEVVRERTLLYRAQREGKQLENDQANGRLAPLEFLEERVMELAAELVGGAEQLAARAAADCVGLADETAAVAVLERHTREMRDGVAARVEAMARNADKRARPDPSGA